jgi:hypothetical protein
MFKIVTEKGKEILTFEEVAENQFFVDISGNLCQKSDYGTYTVIANKEGKPSCFYLDEVSCDTIVKKIFPKVQKIEF